MLSKIEGEKMKITKKTLEKLVEKLNAEFKEILEKKKC